MVRKKRFTLKLPFYLWIVSVYPIFHLYLENYGMVIDAEVLLTAATALAATTLAFVLTRSLLHDIHERAVILAIWSLTHSLSGHIYVEWIMPFSLTIWTLALILMAVTLSYLVKRASFGGRLNQLSPTFNLIAAVMLAMQLAQLASLIIEDLRAESIADALMAAHGGRPAAEKALDSPELPDIYYIIPDAYPSDAWHMEAMNHDNSAFTEALQALGFQVAAHAQSNYSATNLSLPSTLNMRYFEDNPTEHGDVQYLRLMVNNSAVARELLRRGYTYVQLRTSSIGPSPLADINKIFTKQGYMDSRHADFEGALHYLLDAKESFVSLYIDTTLMRTVKSQLTKLAKLLPQADVEEPGYWNSTRFLKSLAELEEIAQMPEATFTIVHLEKPHWPVTFNREGEIIGSIKGASHEQYVDELHYINQEMLATLTALVEASPRETVIILQADHGSTYGMFHYRNPHNTYFDVYAGYYLPPGIEVAFPDPFSNVNSFPLLLNSLFDADFGLQEDRFFTIYVYNDPLNQFDYTEKWLRNGWG